MLGTEDNVAFTGANVIGADVTTGDSLAGIVVVAKRVGDDVTTGDTLAGVGIVVGEIGDAVTGGTLCVIG